MEKNKEIDGVIPVFKDKGMTSHDVVAKLRRILGTKKIGHTGTLDPEVTGVLPICVGKATRISEYIMEMPKAYEGQLKIGFSTTTQDATGEIVEQAEVKNLTIEEIKRVFSSFIGEIEQIPPMYSAVKVKGKRLYELAREGKEIKVESRKVNIYEIKITDFHLESEFPTVDFYVKCSKGTYIRTLCFDIGRKLGYPAHMSFLQRIESGNFKLPNAYTIEEIEEKVKSQELEQILVSMNDSLPLYKELVFDMDQINRKVLNGQRIKLDSYSSEYGMIKIVDQKGQLHALYQKQENSTFARPIKVFK